MAYRYPVVSISIAADLLKEVRALPLPEELKTTTKKVAYLLRLGVNYINTEVKRSETE